MTQGWRWLGDFHPFRMTVSGLAQAGSYVVLSLYEEVIMLIFVGQLLLVLTTTVVIQLMEEITHHHDGPKSLELQWFSSSR